jgi:Mg-chelatase subunit ChlD
MAAKKKVAAKKATKKSAKKKTASRKTKAVQPQETYVAVVVDRSGSMSSIYEAALSGVNEQVKTLKANANVAGKTFVSFIQFDDKIDVLFSNRPAEDLEEFKDGDFSPRGTTAMYDGVGKAISELSAVKTSAKNVGYLVVVISDGWENASKDYNKNSLAAEISRLQATGKWTFTYMLANQDLSQVSRDLNVPITNMSSFAATPTGVKGAYVVMNSASANYMGARSRGIMALDTFYDDQGQTTITGSVANTASSIGGTTTGTYVNNKNVTLTSK